MLLFLKESEFRDSLAYWQLQPFLLSYHDNRKPNFGGYILMSGKEPIERKTL